jgi:hypothetical protein
MKCDLAKSLEATSQKGFCILMTTLFFSLAAGAQNSSVTFDSELNNSIKNAKKACWGQIESSFGSTEIYLSCDGNPTVKFKNSSDSFGAVGSKFMSEFVSQGFEVQTAKVGGGVWTFVFTKKD